MNIIFPKAKNISHTKMEKERWGNNQLGVPIYDVVQLSEFNQLIGYTKFINNNNGTVLYRGQNDNHKSLEPSGCRIKPHAIPDITISKICSDDNILHLLKLDAEEIKGWENYQSVIIESTLQHYGAPTYCMDFVDNHWCALWFGSHKYRNGQYYQRDDLDNFMFLYMCLADTNGPCIRGMYIGEDSYTIDLRKALPSIFLRPAAQHAWVIRKIKRVKCNYDNHVVCIAKIKVGDAINWLGKGNLVSFANFFPNYKIDNGYGLLLQNQKDSGVLPKKKNMFVIPKNTISNLYYSDSFYSKPKKMVKDLKPVYKIKTNKSNVFIQDITDLYSLLLNEGWDEKTYITPSYPSDFNKCSCCGQSFVTSILVQKCFGGKILTIPFGKRIHYFNQINKIVIDLTSQELSVRKCVLSYRKSQVLTDKEKGMVFKKYATRYQQLIENCKINVIE